MAEFCGVGRELMTAGGMGLPHFCWHPNLSCECVSCESMQLYLISYIIQHLLIWAAGQTTCKLGHQTCVEAVLQQRPGGMLPS